MSDPEKDLDDAPEETQPQEGDLPEEDAWDPEAIRTQIAWKHPDGGHGAPRSGTGSRRGPYKRKSTAVGGAPAAPVMTEEQLLRIAPPGVRANHRPWADPKTLAHYRRLLEDAPPVPEHVQEHWITHGIDMIRPDIQAAFRWVLNGHTQVDAMARIGKRKCGWLSGALKSFGLRKFIYGNDQILDNWRRITVANQEKMIELLEGDQKKCEGERGDYSGLRNLAVVGSIGTEKISARRGLEPGDEGSFVAGFRALAEEIRKSGVKLTVEVEPMPEGHQAIDVTGERVHAQ